MQNVPSSVILIIAAVLMTAVLATSVFFLSRSGLSSEQKAANNQYRTVNEMNIKKWDKYSGKKTTGSQILDIIQDIYYDDIPLSVETDSETLTFKGRSGEPGVTLADELITAKQKISMNAVYTGTVTYSDANGSISGIAFKLERG
jgi:hypothetical protein